MVRNYVTIGVRNLLKHKGYSAINVLGLSVGIACCILIALFIQDEFAYERFHANGDRIYRLVRQTEMKGSNPNFNSRVMGPLAPAIKDALPEVEAAVRIWRSWKWVTYGDKGFSSGFCVAEGDVLDVFSFPLVRGDRETALKDPYSVVITERTARRYFGDEDPIGKVLTAHTKYIAGDYTVTGILKDLPRQSHLSFDILTTTVTSSTWMQAVWNHWRPESGYRPVRIYLMLKKTSDPVELERKLPPLVQRVLGQEFEAQNTYHLQPIFRIRLYSHVDYGSRGGGDIRYVYMLSSIALFVLVIACINFMNLATARSATRAKEVGMRKVVGAYRAQLIHQFLGESILVSSLAFVVSLLMVKLALPTLNAFTRKELTLFSLDNTILLSMLPLLAISVGILAGSYPAFFLSSFQPVQVLKGSQKVASNVWLRKTLVIVQFAISVSLIIGTLVVYNQMSYIQTKRLGFDKDHLVMTHLFAENQSLTSSYKAVKAAFLQHPDILKASASLTFVGIWGVHQFVRPEGFPGETWRMFSLVTDEDFLDTFSIELIQGRNLYAHAVNDSSQAFLLNETAVKQLGWKNPIGKRIEWNWSSTRIKGTVVGVVKDFHVRSLRDRIEPVILLKYEPLFRRLAFKIRGQNVQETLAYMEETWKQFVPDRPFNFVFLEDNLNGLYREDLRVGKIFRVLSFLAVFVASLGLFGLVSFTTQQRTKEIGIRKVLGAGAPTIVRILCVEVVILVAVANLIAWPVTYYTMSRWLNDFAYRIDLGPGSFLLGGLLALAIALATVGYQVVKAAGANPVDALRFE